jgi:hypothetical protein
VLPLTGLLLGGCTPEGPADPTPIHTRTQFPSKVDWAPPGSAAPIVISDPGSGGTRTVRVGDRIRLQRSKTQFGGLRLDRWEGWLVPYGASDIYLAVAPGEVTVENTVYDEARPCVPPKAVSEFRLVIADGPRPPIPPARQVYPSDAGRTIELVPGQRIVAARGLDLNARDSGRDVLREHDSGTYAVRPGTATVVIEDRPRGRDRLVQYEIAVRVLGSPSASATGPRRAALPAAGSAGLVAAGPAAAPMCG